MELTAVASLASAPLLTLGYTQIKGRRVVVDWALSKAHYQLLQKQRQQEAEKDADMEDSGSETGSDGEEEEDTRDELDAAMEEVARESINDVEADELDGSEEEGEEAQEGSEEEEEESDSEEEGEEAATEAAAEEKPSDVVEGCTLFLRNVPYTATEQEVAAAFRPYGKLRYCKVVMDPATQQPRGTAFVKVSNAPSLYPFYCSVAKYFLLFFFILAFPLPSLPCWRCIPTTVLEPQ